VASTAAVNYGFGEFETLIPAYAATGLLPQLGYMRGN
jgi:hypothetical protein